jgi:hypothetical protein
VKEAHPSEFALALGKALMLYVARKARQECMMQVAISKAEQLVRENNARFDIPPTIGGTMTKVANPYFNRVMQAAGKVPHIIDSIDRVPHEVLCTDSEQTGGPRNSSVESVCIDLNETSVVSPSSDYVSTLRDPNESEDRS